MLQLAAVAAAGAFFGVAVLRVVVAGAVVFAVLRLVVLAVGWLAFVAATLRVERGISDAALVARSPRAWPFEWRLGGGKDADENAGPRVFRHIDNGP